MSATSLLDVAPKDLRFRVDSKKQPPTVLYLTNRSSERVAFKVKTTAPKRYCVKPSADVVAPNGTTEVKVFIQHSKDLSAQVIAECRDKFLIQSTPVTSDWDMKNESNGSGDVFNKRENAKLVEEKLKVTLEKPPAPPSPVPEASETTEFAAMSPTSARGAAGVPVTAQPSGALPASANATSGGGESVAAENRLLREKLALAELRDQENSAAAKVGTAAKPRAQEQITLLHLVLVAIVAYILGLYLH